MHGTLSGWSFLAAAMAAGTSTRRVFITATVSVPRTIRPPHQYDEPTSNRFAQAINRRARSSSVMRRATSRRGALMYSIAWDCVMFPESKGGM